MSSHFFCRNPIISVIYPLKRKYTWKEGHFNNINKKELHLCNSFLDYLGREIQPRVYDLLKIQTSVTILEHIHKIITHHTIASLIILIRVIRLSSKFINIRYIWIINKNIEKIF